MTTVSQLLVAAAEAGLLRMDARTGTMPAGWNGPYRDPETPVRNTSHWLLTYAKAHQLTGDRRFTDAVERGARYLTSDEARPNGKTFRHRVTPRKDSCNGLIGQAWTIEALMRAAKVLDRPDLRALAQEVFLLHPYDSATGLWSVVDVDGSVRAADPTFNHQLAFAAAGGLLVQGGDGVIQSRITGFMDRLVVTFGIHRSGLIRHGLRPWSFRNAPLRAAVSLLREAKTETRTRRAWGYHAFNLFEFALLRRSQASHAFWRSDNLAAAIALARTERFEAAVDHNTFAFSYNPTGIEMAVALQAFAPASLLDQQHWMSLQLRRCYDTASGLMERGTDDPATLSARMAHATWLDDFEVST